MDDKDYVPSAEDIMTGLADFVSKELVEKATFISDKSGASQVYQQVFQFIQASIAIKEPSKMLWKITEGQKDFMSDRNLWNPRSKANALVMYLCSMDPSFYLEINKAVRLNDKSNLEYLGPLARALSIIHEGTKEKP